MSEKLSITLPAEMVAAIKESVDSGRYSSTSEVLREAMRAWMRDEEEHAERLAALRARIKRSLDDPKPTVPLDDAFVRVRAHADRLLRSR
ncbi:type II toxin-antitoxin system ParD family antitoxin [Devosia sp. YIM 151766]|uniref:type II toxin-antitoxin system ParD family antitoxin n=1 Tax=Devosia sp. YIM 151766 TaxID=3017325 RepID=UPI00255C5F40|nr:type II toxin-antitoxin system ParD family antitoxin [Devosia sp. YIM 151766]WIY51677.1 type II toxin-antitoxin system ParD family antitoxin [Devosia sp. YIM 151766]